MTAANYDLNGAAIIEQGAYWSLTLRYPGNVAEGYFRGQIKADYGGALITDFRNDPPVYSELNQETTVKFYLNASQTKQMQVPDEFYRYDIIMFPSNSDPIRLLQGKVYVSPGITL